MIAFGHGTPLSDEDFNLMSPLLDIAARIYLLTNDLYSWPTEKYQNKDHITNTIFLYIKTQTMSEESGGDYQGKTGGSGPRGAFLSDM